MKRRNLRPHIVS